MDKPPSPHSPNAPDATTDATEELFVGRRFRVVRHTSTRDDGTVVIRETVQHPGAVTIVPMVDADHVCLVRNYRVAVGQWLLELPAGTLEPGEDPPDCALRELAEETGYRAPAVTKLTEFFMSPGILNERMHLFLATDLTPGEAAPEVDEELQGVVLSWDEALQAIESGEIRDAKSIAGLLFYDRRRRRVR